VCICMSASEDTWACYFCAWDNALSVTRCTMCTIDRLENNSSETGKLVKVHEIPEKNLQVQPTGKDEKHSVLAQAKALENEVVSYLQFAPNDPVEYFDEVKKVWISGVYMGNDNHMYFVSSVNDDIVCVKSEWVRFSTNAKQPQTSLKEKINDIKLEESKEEEEEEKETKEEQEETKEEETKEDEQTKDGQLIIEENKVEETKKEEIKSEEMETGMEEEKTESQLKMDKKYTETDEWEKVNDFVFSEYIRDIVHTIPDLLKDLDQFVSQMELLGVYSERSRSRALKLLVDLKAEIETQKTIELMQQNMTDEEKMLERRYLMVHKSMATPESDKEKQTSIIVQDKLLVLGDPSSNLCVRCEEIETVAWNIYHLRQCQHAYCIDCFRKDMKKWVRTTKDEIYALSSANKKNRAKYRRLKSKKK